MRRELRSIAHPAAEDAKAFTEADSKAYSASAADA
jgi:hypothetical protein